MPSVGPGLLDAAQPAVFFFAQDCFARCTIKNPLDRLQAFREKDRGFLLNGIRG
jgi:hypothetical protein